MLQDILDGGNAIIVKKRPTKIYRIMEKPRVLFEECPALGGYTLTVRDDWSYKPKKVSVTPQEKEAYEKHFGNMIFDINMPPAGHFLEENELIRFGTHTLKVIETPGHSRGSVCFYEEEEGVLFSGDTLFQSSIGRTDLDGGSMMMIIQSLRMLCQLPDSTVVYPGHGLPTTMGDELAHNPYLDR